MFEIEIEPYEELIDERHSEVFYNGCIPACEDPFDYITAKEAVKDE